MQNIASYVSLQQHAAAHSLLIYKKERPLIDSPYLMETPVITDTGSLKKCGLLTKKDVLRWSVDSALFRAADCMIRSDFFTFGPCRDSKFYLIAFSNAATSFFSVGLCRIPVEVDEENNLTIKVAFSLLDIRDRCHHTCERFLKDGDAVQASFDRSCYTNHHLMFLREGKLTLHCALDVDEVLSEDTSEEDSPVKEKEHVESLSRNLADDLRSLLQEGLHTDVTLCVGDQEFKAHRSILAARSKVFAKMFEHDTLEKKSNRIIIEDLTPEAMNQLLRFLYTGDMEELTTLEFLSLFVAADKYDLPKLKKNCSASLGSRITSDMALNVLVVANLHGDDDLKEAAIQTVLDNAVDVMKSEEWLTFLREYPEVANSIILNLAMRTVKIKDKKTVSKTKQTN